MGKFSYPWGRIESILEFIDVASEEHTVPIKEIVMSVPHGQMECKVYTSAFSGEVVFQVDTKIGQPYAGVAPKHYIEPGIEPTKDGVDGRVKVRVLSNGGDEARVSVPDGEILTVSADKVHEM